MAPHPRLPLLAGAAVSLSLAACQAQPASPTATPSAHPTATPSATSQPTPGHSPTPLLAGVSTGTFLGAQADGVGNMACNGESLFWTTGNLTGLRVAPLAGGSPRALGGNVAAGSISPLVASTRWLAYVVYQQAGDGTTLASWTLDAVEISSGRAQVVARGTGETQLRELPMPSVEGDTLVWDELSGPGVKVLDVLDLSTGQRRLLPLPQSVFPVRPWIDGDTVAFLDNATDPARGTEFWATRGGRPMVVHLDGRGLRALDGPPNAQTIRVRGGRVAWVAPIANPDVPGSIAFEVQVQDVPTEKPHTVGPGGVPLLVDDSAMAWYDDGQRDMMGRVLPSGTVGRIPLDAPGSPGGLALCGSRLYFAGTGLAIKYLQLPAG